ncbi:MAG: UbiA family prenyltransferase [Flavipsychrobacter sp.]
MFKSLFNRFSNWLLYTSVFAAFCATGLSIATEQVLIGGGWSFFTPLHTLVFCSTLLVYNTHYIIKKTDPKVSDRFCWSTENRIWHLLFLGVGAIGCGISVLFLSREILLACMVLGALSFAYSIPLLPFKNKKRIKDFGWVKILVLTTVWTIVTAVLPMLYHGYEPSAYIFELVIRFTFMFTLCAAFDIRDMQTDMDEGIATLPNLIGVKGTYGVMSVSMLAFLGMAVVRYTLNGDRGLLIAELTVALFTKLVVDYAKKYPSDRAYLGLVDGMMLIYAFLVILWA